MSSAILVRADRLVTSRGVVRGAAMRLHEGRIAVIEAIDDIEPVVGERVLDAPVAMPGFIDLHTHGFAGHAFGTGTEAAIGAACALARTGVTTCYATLGHGATFEDVLDSVRQTAPAVGAETGGARIAGIALEGPYINPEMKGAWDPTHLRAPSIPEFDRLAGAAGDTLRRINLAPELPGAVAVVRHAVANGVLVSLGHSAATSGQARTAIDAGATIINHTFNAMSGLHHRAPGLVGEAMANPAVLAELIFDGVHVDATAARALYAAKGPNGIAIITDNTPLAGRGDGRHRRDGRTVTVAGGAARLDDGTLAGSVSPFDRNLRLARLELDDDLNALAALTSGTAARAMGISEKKGALAPGFDADLVLLDEDLNVLTTIVAGEVTYDSGEGSRA